MRSVFGGHTCTKLVLHLYLLVFTCTPIDQLFFSFHAQKRRRNFASENLKLQRQWKFLVPLSYARKSAAPQQSQKRAFALYSACAIFDIVEQQLEQTNESNTMKHTAKRSFMCSALNTSGVSKNNNLQQFSIIGSNNNYWIKFLVIIGNFCFSKPQNVAKEQEHLTKTHLSTELRKERGKRIWIQLSSN